MADKHKNKKKEPAAQMDEDVAAILKAGEAGIGTVIDVAEAAEKHYFGAVAASTPAPGVATTNSTW